MGTPPPLPPQGPHYTNVRAHSLQARGPHNCHIEPGGGRGAEYLSGVEGGLIGYYYSLYGVNSVLGCMILNKLQQGKVESWSVGAVRLFLVERFGPLMGVTNVACRF